MVSFNSWIRMLVVSGLFLSGCQGVTDSGEVPRDSVQQQDRESPRPDTRAGQRSSAATAAGEVRRVDPAQMAGIVEEFQARVAEYEKLRAELDAGLPKLKDDTTPEEIEAHKKLLADRVRNARKDAPVGAIFSPAASRYFRQLIGQSRSEDKAFVEEEKPEGVPLRVNHPYPDEAAYSSVPPSLLQRFPKLPEDIQYRFVNRNLVLLDSRAGLIIDFIPQKSTP